jgi:hypothetical protein
MARLLYENYGILNDTQKTLADLTTLFLGIYPFSKVKMAEVLYVGEWEICAKNYVFRLHGWAFGFFEQ